MESSVPSSHLLKLQKDLDELVGIVARFSVIIKCHLNEFFTSNIWEKTSVERQELIQFLTENDGENKKKFWRCCYFYSSDGKRQCHRFCKQQQRTVEQSCDSQNKNKKMNSFLSLKKEHEVLCLSKLLKDIADETNCHKVSDIFINCFF